MNSAMRWQPPTIGRLVRVREVRMRLAELELTQADRELVSSRDAERRAQEAVVDANACCVAEIRAADQALLSKQAGGRVGIGGWHNARRQIQDRLQSARDAVTDAVSDRIEKDLECDAARKRWANKRLDVERLRLLIEGLGE
jgi:hypothetical protein